MQDNEQAETYKVRKFCQVCRHFCDEGTGHEAWCPVFTGVTQPPFPRELLAQQQQAQGLAGNPVDIQELKEEWAMLKQGMIPREDVSAEVRGTGSKEDGYEVARIYRESRDRLLEELSAQVEVNRRLSRELIDVRLENAQLKMKYGRGN